ncbi:substrate-binding domain-containing protein [Marinomonas mediterranea]|jgi:monosaccharide ABC transporter substrate-binding protein, CUT2 family (TC 3.A.1.2.-)|uniref:Ribose ABC transporter, periplasmic ribose-binding protein n=1 Tax=Marinomonas mediterranea (strain ATCC 700492 / JCM 21426 / NBRC 103028 / MMB-1) TaxID=717774 RepID=F2K3C4_MARM1|nr:substrate-binding domain-containing protein [Marinomonas mediterranea]ADZ91266.1 ribose ABC transporter, periplasmic ribose-binding protein [Marinomonas mediterranea MMB-1]WCN09238.1 substrate-binding domain-containing protein [Marinomonas mediterranea]WCN13320.1 substrate-binding domain-containing protein [Marinomonas mediterranea]WCN17388.1 substrate-binding domain-containing protein [Marinomonas mediterranea MMB-1]
MTLQKTTFLTSFFALSTVATIELANADMDISFNDAVSTNSVPVTQEIDSPIRIALIYPSADISDYWIRNYKALVGRLSELNIPYTIKEYSSRQIEHFLQSKYVEEVVGNETDFDFVIFGPTELNIQSKNIQKLSASDEFYTFIWAFHTPDPDWKNTPDAWFDFSSAIGAKALCNTLSEKLGSDVYFALNRGIPGITDTQRSQLFSDCVEEKADWLNVYEHFGQYQKGGGADGAHLVAKNFPEVTLLHNANTAMTMGAIEALKKDNKLDDIYVTGWGGTAKEIEKIKLGELNATPMRMSDDAGVATAEAIKYYVQGKKDEVPNIYLGRITVVTSDMDEAEIDALSDEAFRYSSK